MATKEVDQNHIRFTSSPVSAVPFGKIVERFMRGQNLRACDKLEAEGNDHSGLREYLNAAKAYERAMEKAVKLGDKEKELRFRLRAADSFEEYGKKIEMQIEDLLIKAAKRGLLRAEHSSVYYGLRWHAFGYFLKAAILVDEGNDNRFIQRVRHLITRARVNLFNSAEETNTLDKDQEVCGVPQAIRRWGDIIDKVDPSWYMRSDDEDWR
jgi:hypothetical protein